MVPIMGTRKAINSVKNVECKFFIKSMKNKTDRSAVFKWNELSLQQAAGYHVGS